MTNPCEVGYDSVNDYAIIIKEALSLKSFRIEHSVFTLDGNPIQIISGAIHYFRVHPDYWRDRLVKLKACGFNAVETYLPWNHHEPRPGEFRFDGILDVVRFVGIAEELGLLVILRPCPYICAEWDFGGLPAWLLADPGLRVRCMYPGYVDAVDRYYNRLLPMLAPLQCTQGGPVIAMQIENEYGSFGNDAEYLAYLEDGMRRRGIDVLLFTSDGPTDKMLLGGTLPGVFKTANFGSNAGPNFEKLREHQPDGPMVCMEFWNGWFDTWGADHVTRDAVDAAECLESMLSAVASINCYMFHGGTNFGFGSGANFFDNQYRPVATSYDYDAPVGEDGALTAKFHAYREVIGKYRQIPEVELPSPARVANFGTVEMVEQASLMDNVERLSQAVRRTSPVPMESLGQNDGFILYRTRISGPRPCEALVIDEVHDRAHVFVDGVLVGIQDRNDVDKEAMKLEIPAGGVTLDILVENRGRINFGPYLVDRKGITRDVRLGGQNLFGWDIFCLPLDDLASVAYRAVKAGDGPAFYRGYVDIETPADTYVSLPEWSRGCCFVNGFNLGRYLDDKPRRNLYLPGPLLRRGRNEVVVLELDGRSGDARVELVATAVGTPPT